MNQTGFKNLSKRQIQIIEAALEIIATIGIQNLTIKTLAAKIDVTEGALYRHFSSKNEILGGIADLFKTSSTETLDRIVQSQLTGGEKIKAFLLDRSQQFVQNPTLVQVMFSEEMFKDNDELKKKVHETMQAHRKLLNEAILEGQKTGQIRKDVSPQHLFTVIMGAFRLMVTRWKLSGFNFQLVEECVELWTALKTLISPNSMEK